MNRLITCLALGIACAAGAQGTTIHEYPWNPDWNNDNYVGSSDLTGFLSAFGSEFGNPPEPCDYDGTPLENFLFNALEGTVIIDSIFIEFEIENTYEYYTIGCPDPVTDTVIYADANTLTNFYLGGTTNSTYFQVSGEGYVVQFNAFTNGVYSLNLQNWYIYDNFESALFGGYSSTVSSELPFPENWLFNENGWHFEGWSTGWANYANYLHILPYWHYPE